MDRKRHIAVIAGLITLSSIVQLLLIRRATVPALDAVGFVEIAGRIDAEGLLETIRHERQQPLFPAWVWLVHEGCEGAMVPARASWALSVQLAAAIPLVLAVVPVYFLSLRLVGPAPAAAGSLLFCLLPEVSRLGADGLGDALHLLLFSSACWAVGVYLTPRGRGREPGCDGASGVTGSALAPGWNPAWLVVAGALAGLAVLVRTEALVLPAALVVAMLVFPCQVERVKWRQPWSRLATAIGSLALGCGLVLGPYLAATGVNTPGTALARVLGRYEPEERAAPASTMTAGAADAAVWRLADGESMSFAPKETTVSLRRRGYLSATVQVAEELADAFGYLIGALALFGVWRLRRRLVRPVDRFLQVYCLLFLLAVLCFAAKEGYVSARHLLTVVVIGVGCAGYGALELGRRIADWSRGDTGDETASPSRAGNGPARSRMAWTAVFAAAAVCFVAAVKPLHASRLGHRLAAQWLARDAAAPGPVLDTRGWTGLYSGRRTWRSDDARAAFGHPRLAYVVLERRELDYESPRSQTLAQLLDVAGEPVATFPDPAGAGRRQPLVIVYRWEAKRFARWVASQSQGSPTRESRHARVRSHVFGERL